MILEILGNTLIFFLLFLWQEFRINKANVAITEWADMNKYSIIESEFKLFIKGPFLSGYLTTLVYKISLCDMDNLEKKCWVRVGDRYMGMLNNKDVHVVWD